VKRGNQPERIFQQLEQEVVWIVYFHGSLVLRQQPFDLISHACVHDECVVALPEADDYWSHCMQARHYNHYRRGWGSLRRSRRGWTIKWIHRWILEEDILNEVIVINVGVKCDLRRGWTIKIKQMRRRIGIRIV